MRIFKPWEVVANIYTRATITTMFRESKDDIRVVLKVKQRRNGTYKYRCEAYHVSGDFLSDLDLFYILSVEPEEGPFHEAVKKYNLQ